MILHIGNNTTVSLNQIVGIFNFAVSSDMHTSILLDTGEWLESVINAETLMHRIKSLAAAVYGSGMKGM